MIFSLKDAKITGKALLIVLLKKLETLLEVPIWPDTPTVLLKNTKAL